MFTAQRNPLYLLFVKAVRSLDVLKQDTAKLNQKVDGLQQSNAELWTAVNSLVVPMQKVHRRVLLHCLREKIYQLLGKPIVSSNISWYDFLHGISNSPEQLRTLNMSADIILFVMTEASVGGLNSAAHGADRNEITNAVLAVQDSTRDTWIQVFTLLYGAPPSFKV